MKVIHLFIAAAIILSFGFSEYSNNTGNPMGAAVNYAITGTWTIEFEGNILSSGQLDFFDDDLRDNPLWTQKDGQPELNACDPKKMEFFLETNVDLAFLDKSSQKRKVLECLLELEDRNDKLLDKTITHLATYSLSEEGEAGFGSISIEGCD
ncbi:MAG: hypothetical protein AAF502_20375 [Bacteroidota bacterium]